MKEINSKPEPVMTDKERQQAAQIEAMQQQLDFLKTAMQVQGQAMMDFLREKEKKESFATTADLQKTNYRIEKLVGDVSALMDEVAEIRGEQTLRSELAGEFAEESLQRSFSGEPPAVEPANLPGAAANFRVLHTRGDGACMFRAISHYVTQDDFLALRIDVADAEDAKQAALRHICCDYMEKECKEGEELSNLQRAATAEGFNATAEYITVIKESKIWGGDFEIHALSIKLKRPIVVIGTNDTITEDCHINFTNVNYIKFHDENLDRSIMAADRCIFIHYNNRNHYSKIAWPVDAAACIEFYNLLRAKEAELLLARQAAPAAPAVPAVPAAPVNSGERSPESAATSPIAMMQPKSKIPVDSYASINFCALSPAVFNEVFEEIRSESSENLTKLSLKQVNQILRILLKLPSKKSITTIDGLLVKFNELNYIAKSEIQSIEDYLTFIKIFNPTKHASMSLLFEINPALIQRVFENSFPTIIKTTTNVEDILNLYLSLPERPLNFRKLLSKHFEKRIISEPKSLFRNASSLLSLYNAEDEIAKMISSNLVIILKKLLSTDSGESSIEELAEKSIILSEIVAQVAEEAAPLAAPLLKIIKDNIETILAGQEPFLIEFYSARIKKTLFPGNSPGYEHIDRITISSCSRMSSRARSDDSSGVLTAPTLYI